MENSFILREHNISSPIPKKTEKGEVPVSRKVTNTFFNPIVPMETASLIDDDVVQPTLLKNYFCNTLCNITLDSGNVSPKGATYGEIITENDIINSDFIICNSENQIEFIQQSLATDKAVTNEEVMKEKSIINDDLIVNNDHIQEDLAQQGSSSDNKAKISISVVRHNEIEMEFDIVGIHPGLANAFRRILLSEVPSMAIEKVLIYNNTSLIQDEVLAHRLGLIPLKADPRLFEYKPEEEGEPTDQDTLKFELKVKCTRNTSARKDSTHPDDLYTDYKVLSSQMKWIPIGGQADLYKAKHLGPVHDDILIAKMRPGHELNLQMLAVKGIGRDHAKFSPVATATYRLLPEITLTQEVEGDLAERLKTCFSPGVIGIKQNNEGRDVAYVENPRYDSCSRNVFRYNDLKDTVNMGRVQDHFIFTIESVGALTPDELFLESVKVLKNKCKMFLEQLNNS